MHEHKLSVAGGSALISRANPFIFIEVPRRWERIASSAGSSPYPPLAAQREVVASPSCSWVIGGQLGARGDPSLSGSPLVHAPPAGGEPASGLLGEEVQLVILTSAVRVCSAGRRRREKLSACSPN